MIPIDTLNFRSHIFEYYSEDVKTWPPIGVHVHGCYLQGAKWDFNKKTIEDSDPKVPIIRMPIIWLEPCLEIEIVDANTYACPLYKTSLRTGALSTTGHSTNYVMFLLLPSDVQQDYWIRRGAALLCMTDN